MNKILLVGSGAREHAMAESLVKNGCELSSFMSNHNPGILNLSKERVAGDLNKNDYILSFAGKVKPDFAVIGPEAPLDNGLVDALEEAGIPCASPRKEMAFIETSKSYARNFMRVHGINAYPKFQVFRNGEGLESFLKDLNYEVAVKPDGLTGGKGVKVWGDHFTKPEQVFDYATKVLEKSFVIIEEKLKPKQGLKNAEFTLQALVSGKEVVPMPLVQDFKRAYDDDEGPNTGSMGSYSCADHSLPFLSNSDYERAVKVMKRTAEAMEYYKGVLYGQFMLADSGVKLVEYNARLGDPEALNVLPLMNESLADCCQEMIDGKLTRKTFKKLATVCVYMTPKDYPENPKKNERIIVNMSNFGLDKKIYFASVKPQGIFLATTFSRSLALLGLGSSVREARNNAYSNIHDVCGELRYRTDIAEGIT